jgi:hypothetical protein
MDRTCRSQRFKSIKKCSFSDTDSKSQDDNAKKSIKQKSNSCEVVSKLLIPEDLIFDILSFLPVRCLINSARYVCKPWATTIHSPFLLKRAYTVHEVLNPVFMLNMAIHVILIFWILKMMSMANLNFKGLI